MGYPSPTLQAAPPTLWTLPPLDPARVEALVTHTGLSRPLAALLLARGFDSTKQISAFLKPKWTGDPDARTFLNGEASLERLAQAIRNHEPILIHGDYDVDGTCGAVLYRRAIESLGGSARVFLPSRFEEGYGVSMRAVLDAPKGGFKVLLTSDTGSQAHAPIAVALESGIDVIVTDHHQLGDSPLPTPYFINPMQPDCPYPFKGLSGGGIALKVSMALAAMMGRSLDIEELLPLAALSTIADVCPLRDENRALVREGLTLLPRVQQHGLRALVQQVMTGRTLTARDCSHGLIPRLNAIGRLGAPGLAAELLLSTDPAHAQRAVAQLEDLNNQRKALQEVVAHEAYRQAESMLSENADRAVLVLASPQWHFGVLGIVASKVVEKFGRPAILLSQHQDRMQKGAEATPYLYSGSGRAPRGMALLDAVEACRDLLIRGGGHQQALGITLDPLNIEAFRERMEAILASDEPLEESLTVDACLRPEELDARLMRELALLEPCGAGNPQPLFAAGPYQLQSEKKVGDGTHRAIELLTPDGVTVRAIHFGCPSTPPPANMPLTVLGTPIKSTWNGRERIEWQVKAITPHLDEDSQ